MNSKDQGKNEGEKQFSIQPVNDNSGPADPKFAAHKAHQGPVISQNMPEQEGSKDERKARKEELNK